MRPSNRDMNKLIKTLLCLMLLLSVFVCGIAFAEDDPIVAEIEVSPNALTAPGTVNVKITVSNSGDMDMKDPVYLYTPQGKVVEDFGTDGSVTLKAGESKTWTGTYDVNNRTLEDGKIVYYIKYTLYSANGESRTEKQPLTAAISKGNATEEGLQVERVITPSVAKEGQQISIKYVITNNSASSLYNVTLQENKSIHKEKQTINELPAGKSVEIVFTVTMGKKDLSSYATITYSTSEKGKTITYKVPEQSIPLGEAGITVKLESSVKGVVVNDSTTLKLTLTNTGTLGYTDIRVTDPTLGEVFSGVELAAGKTITLEKEVSVPETMSFQFTVCGTDETGSTFSVATDSLTITAINAEDALNLEVSVAADRTEVFEQPGQVRFTITISNTSNVDAKEVVLSHGSVTIAKLGELKAGETKVIHRDVAVSTSGRMRFSVTALDPLENHVTFNGNDIQIVISAPTAVPATPTPAPVPTAIPTAPVYTMPSVNDPFIAPGAKGVNALASTLAVIFGVLGVLSLAVFIAAKVKRAMNKKNADKAVDQLQTTEHRDYTQLPEEKAQNAEPTETSVQNEGKPLPSSEGEDSGVEEYPKVKYAQKAGFTESNKPEEKEDPKEDEEESVPDTLQPISPREFAKQMPNYDFDINSFFQKKEEPKNNVNFEINIDQVEDASRHKRRGNGHRQE